MALGEITNIAERGGDFWMQLAQEQLRADLGGLWRIKPKSLSKFGRTSAASSSVTTVAQFQDAVINETFAAGNTIDKVVSTSGSDTSQTLVVEGHTLDSNNNMVFKVQSVALTGQTAATLGTPLYRATRAYVAKGTFASPATALAGDVAVYASVEEVSGLTSGKPDTDTAVKLMVLGTAGYNQSQKCATSISYQDAWIITDIGASVNRASASTVTADIDVEFKEIGGVWRPLGLELSLRTTGLQGAELQVNPPFIIPPNSDVRMVATSNTSSTVVTGRISGPLAKRLDD